METSPGNKNCPMSRREKKRELDRLAQRAARARNKDRIAMLEATIESIRDDDSNKRIVKLLEKVQELTKQRDQLASTLSSVRNTIDRNYPLDGHSNDATGKSRSGSTRQDTPDNHSQKAISETSAASRESDPGAAISSDRSTSLGIETPTAHTHPEQIVHPPRLYSFPMPVGDDAPWDTLSMSSFPAVYPEQNMMPKSDILCECNTRAHTPNDNGPASGSIWKTANQALRHEPISRNDLQRESDLSEDRAIRIIVKGWGQVENDGGLSSLWQKLRKTDNLQFRDCGDPERLAILVLMHRMLQNRADPVFGQWAKLPPWLLSRPSQSLPHSLAIDFFAWPGVRERFVFSEHRYCSNQFWKVFASSFRFVWPFEFRDCYRMNVRTGRYSISPEFEAQLQEITSWTMTVDFFSHFPEMYADIPSFQEIPRLHLDHRCQESEQKDSKNDELGYWSLAAPR